MRETARKIRGEFVVTFDEARVVSPRRRWRTAAIVAGGAGVLMSLTGAFETGEAPLLARTFYWLVLMFAGTGLNMSAGDLAARLTGLRGHTVGAALIETLIVTTLMSPVVWVSTTLLFGRPFDGAALERYVGPVFVLSAAMTALNYALLRPAEGINTAPQPAPDERPSTGPLRVKLAGRLPPHLRDAEILAVSSDDHYLRVFTDRGEALILVRLADAIAELDGRDGAQTHRSWWVARSAVAAGSWSSRGATLTLTSGVVAPVSRTFAKALKEQGWFA
jgi:hypothetical protein